MNYILIPLNSVTTAAMQTTDRYSKEGGQNKEDDLLPWSL
jgi:hypothetical protein